MTDLLIKNGRLVDPSVNLNAVMDIAVTGGEISAIAKSIDPKTATRVIDATGLLVTPGLIDIHTHVAAGLRKVDGEDMMGDVDTAGVYSGVTTVLDAGSTGAYNAGGFVNFIVPGAATRTFALLNVGTLGVTRAPEVRDAADIDIAAGSAALAARPDVLVGVKVRMVTPGIHALGIELPKAAKKMAEDAETGAFVMVHIGDILGQDPIAAELAPALLSDVLTEGDVVTHSLSFQVGALLKGGKLLSEAKAARERGVIFDVGVGKANFSFESAKTVLDQGFVPDTLSSDFTQMSRFAGPTHSMVECMSKMLAIGLPLGDVIAMSTSRPAAVLGIEEETGSLAVGYDADITLMELANGDFLFRDVTGATHKGKQAFRPVSTVRAGEVMPVDFGPRPWGWLPEQA
jgi:dihydroorotase